MEDGLGEQQRKLEGGVQALNPAERELWAAIQKFVDEQARAGGSRDRAFAIVRNLLRKATSDAKARQRRASFKVVD
jgi:hypothetical protein